MAKRKARRKPHVAPPRSARSERMETLERRAADADARLMALEEQALLRKHADTDAIATLLERTSRLESRLADLSSAVLRALSRE